MVSPYREAAPTTLVEDGNEEAPLAQIVVSGRTGQRGRDGVDGAPGSGHGEHGEAAGELVKYSKGCQGRADA